MIKETQQAIELARWTLNSYVKGLSNVPQPELTDLYFNEKAGVFVTLKKDGMLRGCIGIIQPTDILTRNIITSTRNSALNDQRFPPVRSEEVDELEIEVSILSLLRESKLEDIEIGKHGLIVEGNGKSAVYLPQVATEQGWTFDQWLGSLCNKATLPTRYWTGNEAKFYIFTAQIIKE
jgi:AmmeMemoRadiSam system protein A|tara:strand:+ start:201 stop:734 length:534 start_codon:yes stop_codon:yes gene_type:complete